MPPEELSPGVPGDTPEPDVPVEGVLELPVVLSMGPPGIVDIGGDTPGVTGAVCTVGEGPTEALPGDVGIPVCA